MFKKLARFYMLRPLRPTPGARPIVTANDNLQGVRRREARRVPPLRLTCRWSLSNGANRPTCRWDLASSEEANPPSRGAPRRGLHKTVFELTYQNRLVARVLSNPGLSVPAPAASRAIALISF